MQRKQQQEQSEQEAAPLPEWRKRAASLFRQSLHRDVTEYLRADESIYEVFFALLPLCRKAHQANDTEALRGIYEFAQWCLEQQDLQVSNAADVAFYEHLVDHPSTRDAIAQWLTPEVFESVQGLFECRMEAEDFARLKQDFYRTSGAK